MPDKQIRAMDPLGIIALANVLVRHGHDPDCSCELIPVPCSCENDDCSCELIPVPCTCEAEQPLRNLLNMVSNPVFREVVKGLDMNRLKSIEDFLSIADEIRTKIDSAKLPTRSGKTKKSKNKKRV